MKRPCSTVGMQAVHRFFRAVAHEYRQDSKTARDGIVNFVLFSLAGWVQDVINDLIAIARMVDAEAQAVKIFAAKRGDDVAQAVVAAVTAAVFQFDRAFRQIEFVVNDEDFFRGEVVEFGECAHRTTTGIHEGQRFEQMHGLVGEGDFAVFALEFFVFRQSSAFARRECIQ